ncbi:caspase, EACC1-associated type [Streptomyces pinistramenti]|uniref:caspase, EACC1-associated type n=1 Tax=Streptomyces pinistramenti TaxID=2884812 RepID=UPI001D08A402|nr:caspase family protein [Streptomyces pinistramenti]MCB5905889.1 caspase family protein [Streptomyces pinistramenti]
MAESRRYRGLLIGNATFPRDPHALPALDGPLDDIAQLRQVLTDPQVGLFDSADLEALPDHGVQDLREKVDELFTTATRGDVLLLYYSGHGQLDERGTLYLCANDTRTAGLRATALSAIEINNIIEGSPASSTVIILDCCYSGAFKGTAAAPVAGRGRYVLTSSRSTQLARAADRPGHPSPFTGQLVRALRTAQPGKAAEHLTVVEVYRQVHHWMTEDATIAPQLRFAGEGDVALARRPPPPQKKSEPPRTARSRPSSSQKPRPPGGTPTRSVEPTSFSLSAAQRTAGSPEQSAESQANAVGDRRHTASNSSGPARNPISRRAALALGAVLASGIAAAFPLLETEAKKAEDTAAKENAQIPKVLGGQGVVTSVEFSPDGKTLATGSNDKRVRLCDVATRNLLDTLTDHTGRVISVAFSPDGRMLATGSADKTVRLWDVATRRLLDTLTDHTEQVNAVAFSPDNKTLASGSVDETVRLWDVATRRLLDTLTDHTEQVNAVAFSPDNKTLASGSNDETVRLWDVATRRLLDTLTDHTDVVNTVEFSPDNKTLASGSDDKSVRLWDVATRKSIDILTGHTKQVMSVAFRRGGKMLASGSMDKSVRLWDVATRKGIDTLTGHTEAVWAVDFSPDGKALATGSNDKTVRFWEVS